VTQIAPPADAENEARNTQRQQRTNREPYPRSKDNAAPALPSSKGCAAAIGEGTHSDHGAGRSKDSKRGRVRPSDDAEQMSWRKKAGQSELAVRMPQMHRRIRIL